MNSDFKSFYSFETKIYKFIFYCHVHDKVKYKFAYLNAELGWTYSNPRYFPILRDLKWIEKWAPGYDYISQPIDKETIAQIKLDIAKLDKLEAFL